MPMRSERAKPVRVDTPRAPAAKGSHTTHRLSVPTLRTVTDRLLRGLRQVLLTEPYSAREVRARLREDAAPIDSRTAAVHAAAARTGAWTRLLPKDASRESRLGLAASRLPTVVFWYRQGISAEEIGRRLTPFGEGCYGERAIDSACALIADLLNGKAACVGDQTRDERR
jgi:hypothetical protein